MVTAVGSLRLPEKLCLPAMFYIPTLDLGCTKML